VPVSAEGDQAWHMKARSFRRVGSVLARAAVVPQTLGGKRPFRCSRERPYQKAQSRLFAGVGFPVAGPAQDEMELRLAAVGPCSLEAVACTLASVVDSTCFAAPGTAGSTLPAAGSAGRSSHSPGCRKEVCSLEWLGSCTRDKVVVGRTELNAVSRLAVQPCGSAVGFGTVAARRPQDCALGGAQEIQCQ